MRHRGGNPLPTPALPASGEGADPSPASGGRRRDFGEHVSPPPKPAGCAKPAVDGREGECRGFSFVRISNYLVRRAMIIRPANNIAHTSGSGTAGMLPLLKVMLAAPMGELLYSPDEKTRVALWTP